MNWKKRKRLTRLIHKHELDRHSDYKEWVKEWCIVSGYYEKPRYQLLKEWKDLSKDEFIEKLETALDRHAKNENMSKMTKDPIDGELYDTIEEAVDKVLEETSKFKPLSPYLRSIEAFTEFMSNLPPYVPPSKEEWNEGMKRAEAFHRVLNGDVIRGHHPIDVEATNMIKDPFDGDTLAVIPVKPMSDDAKTCVTMKTGEINHPSDRLPGGENWGYPAQTHVDIAQNLDVTTKARIGISPKGKCEFYGFDICRT